LPAIHLPLGRALEPPLARETLRALLTPDDTEIAWVVPRGTAFEVERIPARAFSPLSARGDYVADHARDTLEAWMKSALFELEPFESIDADARPIDPSPVRERTPTETPSEKPRRRRKTKTEPGEPAERMEPVAEAIADRDLVRLERAFFELEAP